eukprot:2967940-Karenia_brevis.AAC.1
MGGPAWGAPFSIRECPYLLGVKYCEGPDDVMFLKAACPEPREAATMTSSSSTRTWVAKESL